MVFSPNEAGLGSAPIAAAAALTGFSGTAGSDFYAWNIHRYNRNLYNDWSFYRNCRYMEYRSEGVAVTTKAFQMTLPFPEQFSSFILMICLVFFAFTTILGWDYYSEKCLEYLSNGNQKVVKGYRWLYILAVFIGPYMTVSAV